MEYLPLTITSMAKLEDESLSSAARFLPPQFLAVQAKTHSLTSFFTENGIVLYRIKPL